MISFKLLLLRKLSLIRVYTKKGLTSFLPHLTVTRPEICALFKQVEDWVFCVHQSSTFRPLCLFFSVWPFKWNSTRFTSGFTITELRLFCGGKHRNQMYADSWLLVKRWWCLLIQGTLLFCWRVYTSNTGRVILILH